MVSEKRSISICRSITDTHQPPPHSGTLQPWRHPPLLPTFRHQPRRPSPRPSSYRSRKRQGTTTLQFAIYTSTNNNTHGTSRS